MKRVAIFLCLLMMTMLCHGQDSPHQANPSLFANYPKYGLLEGKVGRAFLIDEDPFSETARVFYGGAGVNVGLLKGNNLIGLGGAFEFVDLLDDSYSIPLFLMLRHILCEDTRNGFFVEVKAGYILGGKTSFSVSKPWMELEVPGTTVRSLKGPYGEVLLGYSYQGIDFFLSYNYRVVNYETRYVYFYPDHPNYDTAWKKAMHTVMGGVGFRLF